MPYSTPRLVWTLLAVSALAAAGCRSSAPPPVLPEQADAGAAARAIEMYDTNKDGVLDAKELEKAPGLKAAMTRVDANRDGKISADEISQRIQAWAASKAGRLPAMCVVTRKGKPLVGATVAFVPEKFLGGDISRGNGTTDNRGAAQITPADSKDPSITGLSPGFYRVEITKAGENIPPKYNRDTTLGAEVAQGSEGLRDGFKFDLQY